MSRVVLILIGCALIAAAAAGGSTKPLPPPRVAVVGWSPKASYTLGEAVTYQFAIRNGNAVPMKILDLTLSLPAGWRIIPSSTLPSPSRVTGSTVVWRYANIPARRGVRRLSVSLQIGGKPGLACSKEVTRAIRPLTYSHVARRCNKVVDSVFH